jgi:hypothetical protein
MPKSIPRLPEWPMDLNEERAGGADLVLAKPYARDSSLDDGYRAMATDQTREAEALEWCNALAGSSGGDIR